MKVTISVHGRWHAFDLASALYKKGKLNQLITTYPEFLVRKLIPGQFPIASKPGLELRRRLYDNWKVGPKPDLEIAKAFGKFAKKSVMENPGIFVGWSSATLEAIEKVKMLGGKVVVERGSTHIEHQTTVLRTAYEELGCRFEDTHEEIIDRELQEYYAADAICVPTYFAAETFIARGIKKEKVFINPYGVDLSQFTQKSFNNSGLPKRVLFVGAASIRKGIP
ncbi:MAG: glycosyltransferase family 1 protein, partial [Pseudomonadota bacterium]|nr:glycosyltransferase family 1 protein [Pseudomonadota bacterium]